MNHVTEERLSVDSIKKTQPAINKGSGERYMPGDPISVSEAIETDTDSAWAVWQDSTQEPRPPTFAETVPMSLENMPPIRKP